MRILMLHNRYLRHGGEDESTAAEARMLRDRGHYVELVELDNTDIANLGEFRTGLRAIWSAEMYRRVSRILEDGHFNILHVQNFFPLISPSVYYAARRESIPVVQALRNFRLFCVNGLLFREGRVCRECLGLAPWRGIAHACYRDSRPASAAVASMIVAHRLIKTWANLVDAYICLSKFARDVAIAGGLPTDRIAEKPNFVEPDPGIGAGDGGHYLYVGRLSPEKGIVTLLNAWQLQSREYPLKIVGDGPLANMVKSTCEQRDDIEWLGQVPIQRAYELMGGARAVIVPSEWDEPFGRVVIEAYAKGTPVIASRQGALPELVEDDRTGFLFQAGRVGELGSLLDRTSSASVKIDEFRRAARAEFETKYTASANYKALLSIYEMVRR